MYRAMLFIMVLGLCVGLCAVPAARAVPMAWYTIDPISTPNEVSAFFAASMTDVNGRRDHVTMNGQVKVNPVPEPESLLLLGLGLMGLSVMATKRRRRP